MSRGTPPLSTNVARATSFICRAGGHGAAEQRQWHTVVLACLSLLRSFLDQLCYLFNTTSTKAWSFACFSEHSRFWVSSGGHRGRIEADVSSSALIAGEAGTTAQRPLFLGAGTFWHRPVCLKHELCTLQTQMQPEDIPLYRGTRVSPLLESDCFSVWHGRCLHLACCLTRVPGLAVSHQPQQLCSSSSSIISTTTTDFGPTQNSQKLAGT